MFKLTIKNPNDTTREIFVKQVSPDTYQDLHQRFCFLYKLEGDWYSVINHYHKPKKLDVVSVEEV